MEESLSYPSAKQKAGSFIHGYICCAIGDLVIMGRRVHLGRYEPWRGGLMIHRYLIFKIVCETAPCKMKCKPSDWTSSTLVENIARFQCQINAFVRATMQGESIRRIAIMTLFLLGHDVFSDGMSFHADSKPIRLASSIEIRSDRTANSLKEGNGRSPMLFSIARTTVSTGPTSLVIAARHNSLNPHEVDWCDVNKMNGPIRRCCDRIGPNSIWDG